MNRSALIQQYLFKTGLQLTQEQLDLGRPMEEFLGDGFTSEPDPYLASTLIVEASEAADNLTKVNDTDDFDVTSSTQEYISSLEQVTRKRKVKPVKYEIPHPTFGVITIVDDTHILPPDTGDYLRNRYAEDVDNDEPAPEPPIKDSEEPVNFFEAFSQMFTTAGLNGDRDPNESSHFQEMIKHPKMASFFEKYEKVLSEANQRVSRKNSHRSSEEPSPAAKLFQKFSEAVNNRGKKKVKKTKVSSSETLSSQVNKTVKMTVDATAGEHQRRQTSSKKTELPEASSRNVSEEATQMPNVPHFGKITGVSIEKLPRVSGSEPEADTAQEPSVLIEGDFRIERSSDENLTAQAHDESRMDMGVNSTVGTISGSVNAQMFTSRGNHPILHYRKILRSMRTYQTHGKMSAYECARLCKNTKTNCLYFAIGRGKSNMLTCYTASSLDTTTKLQVLTADSYKRTSSATSSSNRYGAVYRCPSGAEYQVRCLSGGIADGRDGATVGSCASNMLSSSCAGKRMYVRCSKNHYDMYEITDGYVEIRKKVWPITSSLHNYGRKYYSKDCATSCRNDAACNYFVWREPKNQYQNTANCWRLSCRTSSCEEVAFSKQPGFSVFAMARKTTSLSQCKTDCHNNPLCKGISWKNPRHWVDKIRLQPDYGATTIVQGGAKFTLRKNYNAKSIVLNPGLYELTMDVYLKGTKSGWTNLMHMTGGGSCCGSRDRTPGIWFHSNSRRLHVKMSAKSNGNDGCDPADNFPLNTWTEIKLTYTYGGYFQVFYGDKLVCSKLLAGGAHQNLQTQKFYLSDPWSNPVNADVRNVKFTVIKAGNVNSADTNQQVVEYQYDGDWGTVGGSSSNYWNDRNARVACRMLGADYLGYSTVNPGGSKMKNPDTWTASEPMRTSWTNGFCQDANRRDQNAGVVDLTSKMSVTMRGMNADIQNDCAEQCQSYPGSTACEVSWGSTWARCYVHTQPVKYMSGSSWWKCMIFKNQALNASSENSPPLPLAGVADSSGYDFRVHTVHGMTCSGSEASFADCPGVKFEKIPYGNSKWRSQLRARCRFKSNAPINSKPWYWQRVRAEQQDKFPVSYFTGYNGQCDWALDPSHAVYRETTHHEKETPYRYLENLGPVQKYYNYRVRDILATLSQAPTPYPTPPVGPRHSGLTVDADFSEANAYENIQLTEDDCARECIDNELCAAYSFYNGRCRLSHSPTVTSASWEWAQMSWESGWHRVAGAHFVTWRGSYSLQQCAFQCMKDLYCLGFTHTAGNKCYYTHDLTSKRYGVKDNGVVHVPTTRTWQQARDHCRTAYNGDLYVPDSTILRSRRKNGGTRAWFGIYRVCSENGNECFRSVPVAGTGGQTLPLRDPLWQSGQPNNYNRVQYCIDGTSTLADDDCNVRKASNCARDTQSTRTFVKKMDYYRVRNRWLFSGGDTARRTANFATCKRLCNQEESCLLFGHYGSSECWLVSSMALTRKFSNRNIYVKSEAAGGLIHCTNDQVWDNGECHHNANKGTSYLEVGATEAANRTAAVVEAANRTAVPPPASLLANNVVLKAGAQSEDRDAAEMMRRLEARSGVAGPDEGGEDAGVDASVDEFNRVLSGKKHGHAPHQHSPHSHTTLQNEWPVNKSPETNTKACLGDTACSFEGDCDSCLICNEKLEELNMAKYRGEVALGCRDLHRSGGNWDNPATDSAARYDGGSQPTTWWPPSVNYGNIYNRRCTNNGNNAASGQTSQGRLSLSECKRKCMLSSTCPGIINFESLTTTGNCYTMSSTCSSVLQWNSGRVFRITGRNHVCYKWCQDLQSTQYQFGSSSYATAKSRCNEALNIWPSANYLEQGKMTRYYLARQASVPLLNEWVNYENNVKEKYYGSCEATKHLCCASRVHRYLREIHSDASYIVEVVGSIDDGCEDFMDFNDELDERRYQIMIMNELIEGLKYITIPFMILPSTKKVAKILNKMLKKAVPAFEKVIYWLGRYLQIVGYAGYNTATPSGKVNRDKAKIAKAKKTKRTGGKVTNDRKTKPQKESENTSAGGHKKICWLCDKLIEQTTKIEDKLNGYLDEFAGALDKVKEKALRVKGIPVLATALDMTLEQIVIPLPGCDVARLKTSRLILVLYRVKSQLNEVVDIIKNLDEILKQLIMIELPDIDLSFAVDLSLALLKFPIRPLMSFLNIKICLPWPIKKCWSIKQILEFVGKLMSLLPSIPVPFKFPDIAKLFGVDLLAKLGEMLSFVDFGKFKDLFDLSNIYDLLNKILNPDIGWLFNAQLPWCNLAPVGNWLMKEFGMDLEVPEVAGLTPDMTPINQRGASSNGPTLPSGVNTKAESRGMDIKISTIDSGVNAQNKPDIVSKNTNNQPITVDYRKFPALRYPSCSQF